jgi:hypothetical protein
LRGSVASGSRQPTLRILEVLGANVRGPRGGRYRVELSLHPTLEVPRGEYPALVPEVASCRWEGISKEANPVGNTTFFFLFFFYFSYFFILYFLSVFFFFFPSCFFHLSFFSLALSFSLPYFFLSSFFFSPVYSLLCCFIFLYFFFIPSYFSFFLFPAILACFRGCRSSQ